MARPAVALLRAAFLALLAAQVAAQFPVPARYDGFALGGGATSARPVVVEAFFDLLCPGCRAAWPVLRDALALYDPARVQLIVHPFPVPFHHNANFAARGMHIAASLNASLAYPWMDLVYKHQAEFSDPYTKYLPPVVVVDRFAELATEIGIEKGAFLAGYEDSRTDSLTRISFKYGCHRSVVATPTFLVNGVSVLGADESWAVDDWKALLDPLLGLEGGVQEL